MYSTYPSDRKLHRCRQNENPENSNEWDGNDWAAYLGLDVDASDDDTWMESHFEQDAKCDCPLIDDPINETGDGGPLEIDWSGSVDLTKNGQYTLTARVYNREALPEEMLHCGPDNAAITPWASDEVEVPFTITVGGIWVAYEVPAEGVLNKPQPSASYVQGLPLPQGIPWYDQGVHLGPGTASLRTVIQNTLQGGDYIGNVESGTVSVTTTSPGYKKKLMRWEDGKGAIANCEAPLTRFKAEVSFAGNGGASGNSNSHRVNPGSGFASSSATAQATIGFSSSPNVTGPTSITLQVDGQAHETPPNFVTTVQFPVPGMNIAQNQGASPQYSNSATQGAISSTTTATFMGGGGNELCHKIVYVEVYTFGSSTSMISGRAECAQADASLSLTKFELKEDK